MAEQPINGQPDDGGDETAVEPDDAIGGTVVPFPGTAPPPEVRKPKFSERAELRPILPEHLKTLAAARKHYGWHLKRGRHHFLWHLVRSPARVWDTLRYSALGLLKLGWIEVNWWWVTEQTYLRSQSVAQNDPRTWESLHKHAIKRRAFRGGVLGVQAAAIALLAGCGVAFAPWWAWALAAMTVLPVLAWYGRPADKPIISSAVVPVAFELLTQEVVVRALGSIGLAGINQAIAKDPERAIIQLSPITRDGPGWRADEELPYGVTAAEVMDRRDKLASGLRRQIGCVWPENDRKRHPGALILWVGDEDMSKAEQPRWPLAVKGAADMFAPIPFATDQRGRPITVTLMFASAIIGSIPRMGKTFLLRLLLLICALDVRAEIHAYDLKGTGDLAPLRPVAHRYRAGDEPEDMEYMIADYRKLRTEMRRRTKVIRELAEAHPELCPDNKVTPELSSRKDLGLHPLAIAVDECQVAFEHPQYGDEFETIATDLTKRGPALGIFQILATQRPDAKSIPTGISANVVLRMCLKVMGQMENDMVLGTSSYKNGIRATMFDFEDKGIFYFGGEGSAPRICRGQKLDGPESREIVKRARIMREQAGRLTGYALGLDQEPDDVRSFAADVLLVFGDAKSLWSETIAARLADSLPGAYADITPAAVGSQLRALSVKVGTVREAGKSGRTGCYRADVEAVAGPAGV
jgi:S-DNA-T family DNA segregation ATPase FtsK/SpoIIIE